MSKEKDDLEDADELLSNEAMDFSKDIVINKFKLADECTIHSSKYWRWSKKLADAKNYLAEEENKLDLIGYEEELNLRKNWDEKNNGKQTENSIKAVLASNEKIKKQTIKCLIAKKAVNILSAAVTAMEHRKSSLDNLVTLYVRNYFSSPTDSTPISDQTEKGIREKLNSTKTAKGAKN